MRYWPQKPPLGVPVNWGDPLAQGLVGCWLMNEGGGNTVYDLSGNGHAGTKNPTTPWIAGDSGPALRFDAAELANTLYLANDTALVSDAWSVVMRIKPDDIATNTILFGWDGLQPSLYLQLGSGKTPLFYMGSSNYTYIHTSAFTAMHDGNWHTVVCTMPGNANADILSAKFYVDTVLYPLGAWDSGGAATAKVGLRLCGPRQNIAREYDGDVSWAMYYNRALSASEIAQLYMTPFRIFQESF